MGKLRFKALEDLISNSRELLEFNFTKRKASEYYGENVFDVDTMQKYVSKEAYKSVLEAIEKGTKIDRKMADQIAAGMKAWSIERGATHYTHWFQPLTGNTAEKHDAFVHIDKNGRPFENFDGKLLVQQEPDASSFPSGGIRNTFEARGYTAWDPSSPAFVIDDTLCIPTIFVAYTGEALDYKTPLINSLTALSKAATEVCQYFDKDVTKVHTNLGWEQEYFLIDESLCLARPDISLTGRTLMGHASSKDQQLDDHYFGAIPIRVKRFMQDLEIEAHRLGIPLKTRHNEVAPNQFEFAPIYEEANLAVDHNQLVMALMKDIAKKHKFRVLLHEKPFKGVNGSGKHNNWSMETNTGVNLLSPGKNPKSNLQFLTFLINTVKAVYDHADLLRASIASASNSHRLGANEAPPAIVSVFLGQYLTKMLEDFGGRVSEKKMTPNEKTELKLDIGKIPEILLDNTDRNRTSPFAFTGNRFEFRAVGSGANCASPMTALCTAVAGQLEEFKVDVEAIVSKGVKRDEAIFQVLKKYIEIAQPVLFEGNNYSEEWAKEAERRGLTNIKNVPEALEALVNEKSIALFEKTKVLTNRELHARHHILEEDYTMKIQIEARVLGDLSINHIVPTAVKYQSELINNVQGLKDIFGEEEYKQLAGNRLNLIREISEHISSIKAQVNDMIEARKIANKLDNPVEKAKAYSSTIAPFFDSIRYHIDKLELIVDDEMWPLPKYREMLFLR
jgi:glutamine synthetase